MRTFGGEWKEKKKAFLALVQSLNQNRKHQETHGRYLRKIQEILNKEISFFNRSTSTLIASWRTKKNTQNIASEEIKDED
jgi:hypothetical protein